MLLTGFLVFSSFAMYAQLILKEVGADAALPRVVKEYSRASFLSLSPDDQLREEHYIIKDLVNLYEVPAVREDKFYLKPSEFYGFPKERKLHILRNPELYLVIPDSESLPQIVIKEALFRELTPEKQANILNDKAYKIEK